jgi:hypothetical protein
MERREVVEASNHSARVEKIWREWLDKNTGSVGDDEADALASLGL